MSEKPKLKKVTFWINEELKKEIDDFAHSLNLASADFYKGGAIMMKNLLERPPDMMLNLFTRSFKDLENKMVQKEILKAYKGSKSVY